MMKKLSLIIIVLAMAIVVKGQNPGDLLMKSKALIDAGKPEEAVSVLTAALPGMKESSVYIGRAEAFMAAGDYSSAINDFNSANELTPLSGEYGLARIYALKGNAATSIYHLESSMKSSFKKSEKDIMLDPSFSLLENKPEWRQFWKKDWYLQPEKDLVQIEYELSKGNTGEAKRILSELTGSYHDNDYVNYASALVNFYDGKYPESIKVINGLLNDNPMSEKSLRLLAKVQEATGNFAGASVTYSKLLDLNISDAELLLSRADCYRKTGETGKAIDDVKKYLDFYPDNKRALGFAGKIESASGDNIKALSYFSENLKLHPNDAECYIDRANSYFVSKSWTWAINDYSMSLDLQPGNSDAWLNKGIALFNSGKTDDACHDFRKSFSLGNKRATEYISKYCLK